MDAGLLARIDRFSLKERYGVHRRCRAVLIICSVVSTCPSPKWTPILHPPRRPVRRVRWAAHSATNYIDFHNRRFID
jgi:hypothetical protein